MTQFVRFLKSNLFAYRVFRNVPALKAACRRAWQWLIDHPDVITKTTCRRWDHSSRVLIQFYQKNMLI